MNDGPQNVYRHAQDTVDDQIAFINSLLGEYRKELKSALAGLSSIEVDDVPPPPAIVPPTLPELSFNLDPLPDASLELGAISDVPTFGGLGDLLDRLDRMNLELGEIPDPPTAPIISIPEAPPEDIVEMPVRPHIDTSVTLPDAPSTALPEMGELLAIKLPEFEFPDLPTFGGTPPAVDFEVPDSVAIAWSEPEYASELFDEIVGEVRRMMAGGTGLPPAVENAIFARSRDRAALETDRAVSDAFADWAARGFDMPPGMLVKQVAVARELGQMRAAEANRDITIEAAKWEIENLRFAVTQGIALEGLTINLFENTVKRLFESARFHAESRISLLNASVAVFNARNDGFRLMVEVYKTNLEGALSKLQAYKTAVEAQAVIGQINEQTVEVFKARLAAVGQSVELFKALMEGVKIKSEADRMQLEAYKTDVQAAAEKLQAMKNRFDAYESRLKGETAKAGVFESQTSAYAETVRAIAAKTDAQRASAQIAADAARIRLSAYEAELRGVDLRNDTTFKKLSTQADVLKTKLSAWESMARASISENETKVRYIDMGLRTNLMYTDTKLKEYEAKLERAIKEASIALESAKALGQYSSQIVAGAMSAVNIGASVSASGTTSDSYTRTKSESNTTNHNYNY